MPHDNESVPHNITLLLVSNSLTTMEQCHYDVMVLLLRNNCTTT